MNSSVDEAYWAEYSNLQQVKHKLIKRYLGGWFPKLASWAGRVLYVDTHAGRGRHLSGDLGSPLVALRTLLEHHYLDHLRRCEFQFHFIERDRANFQALKRELESFGSLPRNVRVHPHSGDAFDRLRGLLGDLDPEKKRIAPAFIFLDPYGFKVPGALLKDLMQAGRVELFVNLMWRELGMALSQKEMPAGMAAAMSDIFDGDEWKSELTAGGWDERADRAVDLLARKVGARWATFIRMLGDTEATRYLLVHFSKHDVGRDLMKEAMWSVCPDGGFYARKSDDPAQQFLISPAPDLGPLRTLVLQQIRNAPCRWQELHDLVRPMVWRDTHVNKVVTDLRKAGLIAPSDYNGRFGAAANPLLRIAPESGKV